eukprot:3544111-Pyramimonas_sp.AAC.1
MGKVHAILLACTRRVHGAEYALVESTVHAATAHQADPSARYHPQPHPNGSLPRRCLPHPALHRASSKLTPSSACVSITRVVSK